MNNSVDKQRIDFITNDLNEHDDVDGLWSLPATLINTKIPSSLPSSSPSSGSSGTMSKLNSLDCWDYTIELECLQGPQDLQLAAELGQNLLARNKELETDLRNSQNIIDDQALEIEYLQKQSAALREVTDSRFRIYEHMEVGIQDLERANHRLKVENSTDKKTIKSLMSTNESLETRIDELNKNSEEINKFLALERRKNERLLSDRNGLKEEEEVKLRHHEENNFSFSDNIDGGYDPNTTAPENCSFAFQSSGHKSSKNANSTGLSDNLRPETLNFSQITNEEDNEEIIRFVEELESIKKHWLLEQQKNTELEEQIITLIQENQTLQGKVAQTSTNEEMKSVHDELSILEEVRQGRMCTRCLRSIDDRTTNQDEASSIAPTEDDDDHSLLDLEQDAQNYRSSLTIKSLQKPNMLDLHVDCPSPNPYRELVEKYEALLEVQRQTLPIRHKSLTLISGSCNNDAPSLCEEFQSSGEFSSINMMNKEDEDHEQHTNNMQQHETIINSNINNKTDSTTNNIIAQQTQNIVSGHTTTKNSRRTPTEFSEAETSSSGFSDETSNKGTQTDDRPGYFLCSIGDGDDCKFSIYDDVSPIDSRFRQRPEYRELFKEIFGVLRKAAEKKEEGEKLPLLDDTHPIGNNLQNQQTLNKVPPVTPANEELPDFGDDTQSIVSSVMSEQSVAMSECITKVERKIAKKHIIEKNQENKPPSITSSMASISGVNSGMIQTIAPTASITPNGKQIIENGRVLTPLKREPLEYLTVGVGIKKKNRKKNRNFNNSDRSDSPILPSPPRVYFGSGKKRRDMRPLNESPLASTSTNSPSSRGWSNRSGTTNEWNGNSMIIYNRNHNQSPTPSTNGKGKILDMSSVQYRSTVSQDLHKLKKLDLSYAEVLRRTDACKHHRRK